MTDDDAPVFRRDRSGQLVISIPVPQGTSSEDVSPPVWEMLTERALELLADLHRRGMSIVYMHQPPAAKPGSYYGEPWSIVVRPADRLSDADIRVIQAVRAPLCRMLDARGGAVTE